MGGAQSKPTLQDGKNLILVGIPGQGKSATGNTILGKSNFPSAEGAMPITVNTRADVEYFDGHRMAVVDTPGILDIPGENNVERAERVINSFDECFNVCEGGFHAVLVVIKYGTRFQGEQIEFMEILETAFGENIFKEHGIVIVTNGDGFDSNHKGKDLTFHQWCENMKGDFGVLLKKCENRFVPFYNKTDRKKAQCVGKLFSLLNEMNTRYTKEMYYEHAGKRKKYLLEVDASEYRETVRDRIESINNELKENPENRQTLRQNAWRLEREIIKRDDGTNLFRELKESVSKLLEDIANH